MISIQKIADISIHDMLARSPVAGKQGAEKLLRECIHRSTEVRYGFIDGKLACMWGLIPPTLLSTTAYLWLLTTDIVDEHKFLFVRHSQRHIEELLRTYPIIVGDVFVENASARRWLRWLGAEFGEPCKGVIKFMIRAKVLHG